MDNQLVKKFWNKKNYWLLAFFASAAAMFLAYLLEGAITGERLAMQGDLYESNFAFIKDFIRAIRQGQNPFFSFSFGMGLNNSLGIAHNALSPFNILYLILWNVDENLVTIIVVMLKIGAIGASFQYFCRKTLLNNTIFSVIFSVFFALSSFATAYGTTMIMWLDTLILLPLMIVGTVQCLKEKKRVLLVVVFMLMFVTQFYLSFMAGVFDFLFVIIYLFAVVEYTSDKPKYKQFFDKFFDWALCAVIAILLSAVVWVPTLFFILGNRAEDSTQAYTFQTTILEIINSLYWGEGQGIYGYYSYIYCGIPTFMLAPFYFISKKIQKKEKVTIGILLGFFLLCMILPHLNLALHAFDQPDSFWYRYSFLISFLLCAMAVRMLGTMEELKWKNIILGVLGFVLFYELMQKLNESKDLSNIDFVKNSAMGFGINLGLLAVWTGLLCLYIWKEKSRAAVSFLAILLVILETATNAYIVMPRNDDSAADYYKWRNHMEDALADIRSHENGFYRTICTNSLNWSADALLGYNGISDFGDIEKYATRNFLSNMGFATTVRATTETGHTPVTDMLLGIKYNIYCPNPLLDEGAPEPVNEWNYAVNPYALSVGYLVDGGLIYYEYPGRNVFENMNDLLTFMTGIEDECFVKVSEDKIKYEAEGVNYTINNEERICHIERTGSEGALYVSVSEDAGKEIYMQTEVAKSGFGMYDYVVAVVQNAGTCDNVGVRQSSANRFRYDEAAKEYSLFLYSRDGVSERSVDFERMNIYEVDRAAFEKQYDRLSGGQLEVTEFKNGHIKGKVNAADNRRLVFLSIPYDPGWSIRVDGKEAEVVRLINGTFMGFFLPDAGEHEVEVDYEVPGFKIGLAVSLCGIVAFLSVVFEKQIKELQEKEKKNREREEQEEKEERERENGKKEAKDKEIKEKDRNKDEEENKEKDKEKEE